MINQTEFVELPSRGLLYSPSSSISSGKVEIMYMTSRHEDILTNVNYIKDRTVIDKLLQALIVDKKVNYNDLLVGDKNTIMIASRILGYGKDYSFRLENPDNDGQSIEKVVDLTQLGEILLNKDLILKPGVNEFEYTLPISQTKVTFKLLTHGDEIKIDEELKGIKRNIPGSSPVVTTRLFHTILSVEGKRDVASIREFSQNMVVRDSKALRDYISKITPNTELKYTHDFGNGPVEESIPITANFFWPE